MKYLKILIIFLVVAIVGAGAFLLYTKTATKGTFNYSVSPNDAVVTLNGTNISSPQTREAGEYTIVIKKPGYITQTKKITIQKNETTNLDITLLENTIGNQAQQGVQELAGYEGLGITIIDPKSFYNTNWVVATVETNSDPGLVVLKKGDNGQYTPVLGPGTAFEDSVLAALPSEIRIEVRSRLGYE